MLLAERWICMLPINLDLKRIATTHIDNITSWLWRSAWWKRFWSPNQCKDTNPLEENMKNIDLVKKESKTKLLEKKKTSRLAKTCLPGQPLERSAHVWTCLDSPWTSPVLLDNHWTRPNLDSLTNWSPSGSRNDFLKRFHADSAWFFPRELKNSGEITKTLIFT